MSLDKKEGKRRFALSILCGVICLIVLWVGIYSYIRWSKEIWEKDERSRIGEVLVSLRSSLENQLYARIYYTKSVAAYVSLHPEIEDDEFHNLAAELVGSDEVINTMSLASDGVITAIHPTEGHEAAIGLNLLDHPERRRIVEQTIRTGKTYVAGPVELVEGGIAFISYTPIFDKTTDGPWEFWGMTDIVILESELFAAAGLSETEDNARIALRGYDGKGDAGAVFFGDPAVFDNNPVKVAIQLPDGEWILGGYPVGGWSGYLDQDRTMLILMVGSSAIIAVLISFLAGAIMKLRTSREQLRELDEDKNRLLSVIAHDLRSPISGVSSLSHELLEPGDSPLSEDQREILEMIHQSSNESLFLLENLLNWVRSREHGRMTHAEEVDLGLLCEDVRSSFQAALRSKSLVVHNKVPEGTKTFFDRRILETVLRNLTSNAIKYSPKGSMILIGVGEETDETMEIFVRDEGAGMSPQRIREILTAGRNRASLPVGREKGSGIGILICRDLLRRGGQEMRIESEEKKGTTVWFSLPKHSPSSEG